MRWMSCSPSAVMESKFPNKTTPYAQEGTIAHAMAEACLCAYLANLADGPAHIKEEVTDSYLKELTARDVDGGPIDASDDYLDRVLLRLWRSCRELGVDPEDMLKTIYDNYVRIVLEDFEVARGKDKNAVLLIEAPLKLSEYIPEGFGSSDAVILYGDTLRVYDLKYGKGVKVDADHNPQMMCYALGALLGPAELYDTDNVVMTIIQPRLSHVSSFEMTAADLMRWALDDLKPKAEKAYKGEGEQTPGDWCKFCRVAPVCKALAAEALSEKDEPRVMSEAEVAESLGKLKMIKSWIDSLEAWALDKALSGVKYPGYKLVEGVTRRKIVDMDAALAELKKKKFREADVCKPKELKGLTELKKILRAEAFDKILGPFIVKPQGAPTLVPEDDPRQDLNSAAVDFANVPDVKQSNS